jgi:ABC-2 type transport system permease protein
MTELTAGAASGPLPGAGRLPGVGPLFLAQVRYQIRLLLRAPRAAVAGVILPALLLVVSNTHRGHLPASSLAGFAVLGLTITAWSTHGISLVAAREAGVLKRWRATPLPAWCYFTGRMVAIVLVATLAGAVTMAIGVAIYHTHLTLVIALGVLVALVLGGLAWSAAATAITGVIPNVAGAWPILSVIYLPVVLISWVFGSISGQPHWLNSIASYLPAEPVINAATRALQYSAGKPLFSGHDIVVLCCWLAGSLIAARVLFRWQPSRPSTPGAAARHGR